MHVISCRPSLRVVQGSSSIRLPAGLGCSIPVKGGDAPTISYLSLLLPGRCSTHQLSGDCCCQGDAPPIGFPETAAARATLRPQSFLVTFDTGMGDPQMFVVINRYRRMLGHDVQGVI